MRMRTVRSSKARQHSGGWIVDSGVSIDAYTILSITDSEGKILFVNDLFCSVSGYAREELLGQTHRLVQSGVYSRQFYQELWSFIRRDMPWRGVLRNRSRRGEDYWCYTFIVPVLDRQRKERQFICIQHDATADIARENRKLTMSMRRETERLLGSIIHEIGNPLTTVKGFLQRYDAAAGFGQSQLELLLTEVKQIEETIQGLNELTKVQQSRDFGKISLTGIVREVLEQVRLQTAACRIDWRFHPDEECWICGIKPQIALLIESLLLEAVRRAGRDGSIKVAICGQGERYACLRIACSEGGGLRKEEDEEIRIDWEQLVRNQIIGHHEAEIHFNQRDELVTEVRFARTR